MGQKNKKNQAKSKTNKTVEVLYQRMGSRWYAFSMVGNEVYYSPVPQEEVAAAPEESHDMDLIASRSNAGFYKDC